MNLHVKTKFRIQTFSYLNKVILIILVGNGQNSELKLKLCMLNLSLIELEIVLFSSFYIFAGRECNIFKAIFKIIEITT